MLFFQQQTRWGGPGPTKVIEGLDAKKYWDMIPGKSKGYYRTIVMKMITKSLSSSELK